MVGNKPTRILLIEDNPGDARLIREMMAEMKDTNFNLEYADRLSAGLKLLTKGNIDVVLLDLSLPDSFGLDTFTRVHNEAPEVAVIVLTGLDDETVGVKAVQEGAQDYLIKGKVDSNLLTRSILYAIERHRMLKALRTISITDELTGLYNRRGFLTLGNQVLKMAKRLRKRVFLLYADIDGMKWINDSFGHQEGDRALKEAADTLKEIFRESDIIARIGGDEFVVLGLINSRKNVEIIEARLRKRLEAHSSERKRKYKLSMSVGIISYSEKNLLSIDELLKQADKLMYKQKRRHKTIGETLSPSGNKNGEKTI